jgi:hypothetical protein
LKFVNFIFIQILTFFILENCSDLKILKTKLNCLDSEKNEIKKETNGKRKNIKVKKNSGCTSAGPGGRALWAGRIASPQRAANRNSRQRPRRDNSGPRHSAREWAARNYLVCVKDSQPTAQWTLNESKLS